MTQCRIENEKTDSLEHFLKNDAKTAKDYGIEKSLWKTQETHSVRVLKAINFFELLVFKEYLKNLYIRT